MNNILQVKLVALSFLIEISSICVFFSLKLMQNKLIIFNHIH
ncbi:hypothetical protein PROVRUST_06391 [Providencia rustigianii DSM 4541]|uniref:Uncharacterized protein n=1 Tax=Providencia rustigianii DSM 4541 TaxID=500637 RepID=D1P2G7_9GAMM|nr:hypothetical protein PROVRUST_06391 [Providencia rustigianii DSM 4541]